MVERNALDTISDEHMLAAYREGDTDAFVKLMSRYEKQLYNFLVKFLGKRSLAEDVFQETFLQVHISADTFNTERRFKPWLFTIAANKARDALRRKARRPAYQISSTDDDLTDNAIWDQLLQDETTPEHMLDKKMEGELVREVVEELPEHLREILLLAYFNQLTYKEMAETLSIPLGTVKSRLHSAVGRFADLYKERIKEDHKA